MLPPVDVPSNQWCRQKSGSAFSVSRSLAMFSHERCDGSASLPVPEGIGLTTPLQRRCVLLGGSRMMCSAHYAVASVVGIPHLHMASTGSRRLFRAVTSARWKTSRAYFLSQRRVESLRTSCASTSCCLRLRRRLAFGLPVVPAMCSPVPSRRFMLCLRCAEAQPTVAVALKGFRQAPSLVPHNLLAVRCERHHLMRRHGFPDVMR
jgi:hypothetical protein